MTKEPRSWTNTVFLETFAIWRNMPSHFRNQPDQAGRHEYAGCGWVGINEWEQSCSPYWQRWLEHTPEEVRLQQRFRIIALFEVEEGVDHLIPDTLAILGVRQKMVLGEIKPSACLDHDCDHVLQHLLQRLRRLVGALII